MTKKSIKINPFKISTLMKKLKNRITGIYEKIINELEMLHNVFTRLQKRFDLNLNVNRKHFLQFL